MILTGKAGQKQLKIIFINKKIFLNNAHTLKISKIQNIIYRLQKKIKILKFYPVFSESHVEHYRIKVPFRTIKLTKSSFMYFLGRRKIHFDTPVKNMDVELQLKDNIRPDSSP